MADKTDPGARVSGALLVAAVKMGWGAWEHPALLSPAEYQALKDAKLLDRKKCAKWLAEFMRKEMPRG